MAEVIPPASGQETPPSGTGDQSNKSTRHIDGYIPKDKVDEILAEKKKLQSRQKEFEQRDKEKEEAKLKEANEWKQLVDLKEKELSEHKTTLQQMKDQAVVRSKLESFVSTIGVGKVDQKYWQLIDLDKIVVNPETGDVDKNSVAKAVEDFKKDYPQIIIGQGKAPLPTDAPQTAQTISYSEWLKLPAKEMRKRLKDIVKEN